MSSSAPSVRVEKLGKRYIVPQRLAADATAGQRFRQHLKEFFPFVRGDQDSDAFWALRDVSFEVRPGEILGILGRNGSGKSTLLKILSGVTLPTEGRAMLRGRVGSLLEVGTGFQPDLTGRENVFMAGALLGIKPDEIRRKFDEIVDFSGIERFIDTPVKRYSSGMYVRLAYAVASQLRCDILILDEVMAVGDAEFRQKSQKNIEKMTQEGRTILFVSHNTQGVKQLCTRGMVLSGGRMLFTGDVGPAVAEYLRQVQRIDETSPGAALSARHDIRDAKRWHKHHRPVMTAVEVLNASGQPTTKVVSGEPIRIRIETNADAADERYYCIGIITEDGEAALTVYSTHDRKFQAGAADVVECVVPELRLTAGRYHLLLDYGTVGAGQFTSVDCVPNAAIFEVESPPDFGPPGLWPNQGAMLQRSHWRSLAPADLRADGAGLALPARVGE